MYIVFPESYAETFFSLKSDKLNCQIQQIRGGSLPCCEEVQGWQATSLKNHVTNHNTNQKTKQMDYFELWGK